MTAGIHHNKKFIFQRLPQKGLVIIGRHLINDTCHPTTEGDFLELLEDSGDEIAIPGPKMFQQNICQVSLFVESCHVQSAAGAKN